MLTLPTQVAIAILYQNDRFLMQLRDDIPTIAYPGLWGLFGGHIENEETPEQTIKRELLEEINYQIPDDLMKFGIYGDEKINRHVFAIPLTVKMDELTLNEGWDFGLISLVEIKDGYAYSYNANETRPLGPVHRQILLDFIDFRKKN